MHKTRKVALETEVDAQELARWTPRDWSCVLSVQIEYPINGDMLPEHRVPDSKKPVTRYEKYNLDWYAGKPDSSSLIGSKQLAYVLTQVVDNDTIVAQHLARQGIPSFEESSSRTYVPPKPGNEDMKEGAELIDRLNARVRHMEAKDHEVTLYKQRRIHVIDYQHLRVIGDDKAHHVFYDSKQPNAAFPELSASRARAIIKKPLLVV